MAFYDWENGFLPYCAAKLVKAEQMFTSEQLEYLHEYYTMNKYASPDELKAIAKQWNIDDFKFYMSLEDWFFARHMGEIEVEQRRYQARIGAA